MRTLVLAGLLSLACAAPPAMEQGAATAPAAPAIAIGTQAGQRAPDFTLPTSEGGEFALSKRSDGPLVVVFFRGVW
jgi:cytochrome oxidase Cu insertion factor (SCO1/SenC/PrrC family)